MLAACLTVTVFAGIVPLLYSPLQVDAGPKDKVRTLRPLVGEVACRGPQPIPATLTFSIAGDTGNWKLSFRGDDPPDGMGKLTEVVFQPNIIKIEGEAIVPRDLSLLFLYFLQQTSNNVFLLIS